MSLTSGAAGDPERPAITALFALLGLVARSPEAVTGYGFLLVFLPYVSSAFVPVSTMPGWLQGFARRQPITPVIESTRALLTGTGPGSQVVVALAWCVGIIVAAAGSPHTCGHAVWRADPVRAGSAG